MRKSETFPSLTRIYIKSNLDITAETSSSHEGMLRSTQCPPQQTQLGQEDHHRQPWRSYCLNEEKVFLMIVLTMIWLLSLMSKTDTQSLAHVITQITRSSTELCFASWTSVVSTTLRVSEEYPEWGHVLQHRSGESFPQKERASNQNSTHSLQLATIHVILIETTFPAYTLFNTTQELNSISSRSLSLTHAEEQYDYRTCPLHVSHSTKKKLLPHFLDDGNLKDNCSTIQW